MHCTFKRICRFSCLWMYLLLYFHTDLAGNTLRQVQLTGKLITLSAKDQPLADILKKISKENDLTIYFRDEDLARFKKVSVDFKKATLDEVKSRLLTPNGLDWVIIDHNTFTVRKSQPPANIPTTTDTIRYFTGRVINEEGSPVPGATILIKGSKKGTATDNNGIFRINYQDLFNIDSITVSSISYDQKQVSVKGRNHLGDIILRKYIGDLDETTIKGYTTTTRRFNTGNIITIKGDDISKQPVSDPLLALQGRVPGMTITQTTGVQGGAVTVQIRGRNSLNSGTQPLFIVDGVPYEPSIVAPGLGNYGSMGMAISALNFLNPSDIESVDILKDADATSIYGSRGANGVILITTKKGKAGKAILNINFSSGIQQLQNKRKLLSTRQYLEMRREAFTNDNALPTIKNAPDLLRWDTTRNADWQEELIGKTANYTDAQVSVSGGTSNVQYLIGGNVHTETTVNPGKFRFWKYGLHVSLSGNMPEKKLRYNFVGSYSTNINKFPGVDFASYIYLPPNAPEPLLPDGSLNWADSTWTSLHWTNPFALLRSKVLDSRSSNILTNADLSYSILPGLNAKVNFGFNQIQNTTFSAKLLAGIDPANLAKETADATYTTTKIRTFTSEPQLSFIRTIGPGTLQALIGLTILARQMKSQYIFTGGFRDDALVENPAAAITDDLIFSGSNYRYVAFFGQTGYILNKKYLLNVSFRRDGSSRFGANKKYAWFWAVGGGWIFSEENWTKTGIPFLSFGKLRGSYGITGNDQIGDYQQFQQYKFQRGLYQGTRGIRVEGIYNPDYEWEKTKKGEIGLEMGFIQDRMLINISRYYTRSSNQLSHQFLPITAGANSVMQNLPALIVNRGWELSLATQNIKRKYFNWSTSINYSMNKNELKAYNGPNESFRTGRPITTVDLFQSLGIHPVSGLPLFANSEGQPVPLNDDADGAKATIDPAPVFQGGIENTFSYRNLSVSVFFQYVKQKGFNRIFPSEFSTGIMSNAPLQVLNRWRKEGDVATVPLSSQTGLHTTSFYTLENNSDKAIGNASFLRCKNINISWRPTKLMQLFKNKFNCTIYFSGQNVFTITNYEGWDPETQSGQVLPPFATYTLGFRFTY